MSELTFTLTSVCYSRSGEGCHNTPRKLDKGHPTFPFTLAIWLGPALPVSLNHHPQACWSSWVFLNSGLLTDACWIVTVNQPINGGHKNDSNSAASSPDHLHQIHKFYLFDKNFYIAHQHVSCTTTKYLKWKYVANYLICSLLWYRLSTPALLFVVNAHD